MGTQPHPDGLPREQIPQQWRAWLSAANDAISFTCKWVTQCWRAGAEFLIENPDPAVQRQGGGAALIDTSWMRDLMRQTGAQIVCFDQHDLGGEYGKPTALIVSPALLPAARAMFEGLPRSTRLQDSLIQSAP